MQPRSCSLFFILLLGTGALSVSVTLETFRGCAVRQFSFLAQKPGCRSLRITTEACWGRCNTWEKPLPEPPYIQRHHRVCTYSRIRYLTARLPACPPDVSPLYPYPLALQCDCAVCSTQDTECETF
ncbi:glycoprotein hormone beta-5-like [Paramormyrops kingsleyae]|uniref:glycoprotein hormone beta-5-like n=1 Tax=Paramormyrops kingsleyae TaxID=1676925 RepID=UPI000CD5CBB8|nr:glycoprotein hormone beta-5-like [Paramormyrops kingsleyae]